MRLAGDLLAPPDRVGQRRRPGGPVFGQFVAHDITADRSPLTHHAELAEIRNARSPRANLEVVYGDGPASMPFLHDRDDPAKLLVRRCRCCPTCSAFAGPGGLGVMNSRELSALRAHQPPVANWRGNEGGAHVSSDSSGTFEDVKVGVRCKIAALWIAMLFLFAYGDIFGFFSPGQIEEVMAGEVSGMTITQVFLFAVSLYIAIASVMVFLSLVLSPTVNRWTNIVLPSLYVVSIVASAIGETSAYYWFLSIVESALLLLIVWYAWTWPRREGTS
jgi:hypothetical protein